MRRVSCLKVRRKLALEGSTKAEVVEEKIVQGAEEKFDASQKASFERTPSTFDRTKEPPYGPEPKVVPPKVWKSKLKNGMEVFGIENKEVPLVNFNIVIEGGKLLDSVDKVGVANLTARMMTQGTKNKTPQEFEAAIQQLGASLNVSAGDEGIRVSGNTLARNYNALMALLEEMMLEPRWDAKEFDRLKATTLNQIRAQKGNPNAIANLEFNKLIYGDGDIRSKNILGTAESVAKIELADVKAFYEKNVSPSVSTLHIVGDITKKNVKRPLKNLGKKWKAKEVSMPKLAELKKPATSKVYFYDVPNAKQSVLRIGYPGFAETDDMFYKGVISNYILGGGGFASRFTQTLREGKGYTYGIRSGFNGTTRPGTFQIGSGVRTNVTLESLQEIKRLIDEYNSTFTENDLKTTQGFLLKSGARAFETAGAKLNILENLSSYDWDTSYIEKRRNAVRAASVDSIKEFSKKYFDSGKMIYVVVGDAKTQMPRLKALGFGDPVKLN